MTEYIKELEEFAVLHARAIGVGRRELADVLRRITHDDGDSPGSWVAAWCDAAKRAAEHGRLRQAAALYSLARFPYVDGDPRRTAHTRSVEAFEGWRRANTNSIRRTVETGDGSFTYLASGLDDGGSRPLLVIVGGIVSPKEQWGPLLKLSRALGMGIAVTEMPGVGENSLTYAPHSWMQLSALLDDLGPSRWDGSAYVLGLSFGGHLAMHCALHDARIRGVATVGAPVDAFFRDEAWWPRLPRVTRWTLAHATGIAEDGLPARLSAWALRESELARLKIPIRYVVSARDEIIPAADPETLARSAPDVQTVCFDDVHGSPNHLLRMRAWLALSLLRMKGDRGARPWALEAFLRLSGARPQPEVSA